MSKTYYLFVLISVCFIFGNVAAQDQSIQQKETTLIQPPYLKVGDTVAILAPSGILKNRADEVNQAVALLKSWGLNAIVGNNVFKKDNHFAGTDLQRSEDFQNALDDPTISAIWCARGGYGTVRILDRLDYTKFRLKPKWVIGYSDITALHNQIHNQGFQSMHALMCVSLTKDLKDIKDTVDTFKSALFGNEMVYNLDVSTYNKVGHAKGVLVGGNLTLLHTMLGSNASIDTSGKILFIEEIGEYKYHIDRMLQSLKRAGYFDNCVGVLVGGMSKMRKNTTPWGTSVEQLILDALSDYDFPIAFGMPAGHEKDNRAMIFGQEVELNIQNGMESTVVFLK